MVQCSSSILAGVLLRNVFKMSFYCIGTVYNMLVESETLLVQRTLESSVVLPTHARVLCNLTRDFTIPQTNFDL